MWALFSLLSAVTMAMVNIMDKFVLTRLARRPIVPLLILVAMGLVPLPFIFIGRGFPPLTAAVLVPAVAAAAAFTLSTILYFAAALREEISRVVPLSYLSPLFVSFLAALFLGEVFPPQKYLGVALLVAGALFISSRKRLSLRPGRAFWLMVLSAICLAGYLTLTKRLLAEVDFWSAFALVRLAMFLLLVPFYVRHRKETVSVLRTQSRRVLLTMALSEVLALAALLFGTIAMSAGPVTLVAALASVQPFFVLAYALFLSHFFPAVLREETGVRILGSKLLAIVLIVLGALLIT